MSALRGLLTEHFVLLLAAVYFLALGRFAEGFDSPENCSDIIDRVIPLLIVATGQTFVVVSGGIDLSVSATIGLSSVVGGWLLSDSEGLLAGSSWAVPAGIAAMLAVGTILGLLNGLAVAGLDMPPFIVTLTSMTFFGGLAVWATGSQNISGLPTAFVEIATGSTLGVPHAIALAIAVAAGAHILLGWHYLGRRLCAVGMNPKVALVSGVPVGATVVAAYVASGVSAGIVSILYTGRLETASPVHGRYIFLDVIAAVVIGGTSLFGGRGKVSWTVQGVLFVALVDSSLNYLNASNFAIRCAKGGLILLAALLDLVNVKLLSRK